VAVALQLCGVRPSGRVAPAVIAVPRQIVREQQLEEAV
jgi:hypothetical protein